MGIAIYVQHRAGGTTATLAGGRRRVIASAADLATALRDAIEGGPFEGDEPQGKQIAVEAIEGGLIATIDPDGDGAAAEFVLPDDQHEAIHLWDALTSTPSKWYLDAEAQAFAPGSDDDLVTVSIPGVADTTVNRGTLRAGSKMVRSLGGLARRLSRPGPKAKAKARRK
jgi:hypothetical protein